jgi:hypothetical protein
MTEKLRLIPSRRRIWMGFFASCLLVGLGCASVYHGREFGWFLIILFGLGVLAPVLLRKDSSWLELDAEGFTLCFASKPSRYLWSHIAEMAIWRGVVSFKLKSEHQGQRGGETTARAISGYDGSIPNIFPLQPNALLHLMMKYQQQQSAGISK